MTQSLSQLYIHLTFRSSFRKPFINPKWEKLHTCIVGILYNIGSPSIITNSVPDHIHILFRMSKIVEIVKRSSSKFIKTLDNALLIFHGEGIQSFFCK